MARIADKGCSSPTALAQLHAFAEHAFGGLAALRQAAATSQSSLPPSLMGALASVQNLGASSVVIDTLITVGVLRAMGINETTLLTKPPESVTTLANLHDIRVRDPWSPDNEISGAALLIKLKAEVQHGYGGVLGNVVQRLQQNPFDIALCKALVHHAFGGGNAEKIITRNGTVDIRSLHYSAVLLPAWAMKHGKTLSTKTQAWIESLGGTQLWDEVLDMGEQLQHDHPARTAADRKQRKR